MQKIEKVFAKGSLAISIVTIQELYEGRSTQNKEVEAYLLATISPLQILPYSFEIAQKAGEIARDSTRSIELADAAIAATTLQYNAQLATLNKKDFQEIPELEFARL